jgi:hypothetical protein
MKFVIYWRSDDGKEGEKVIFADDIFLVLPDIASFMGLEGLVHLSCFGYTYKTVCFLNFNA